MFKGLYLIIKYAAIIILILYIFKVRYLDYYVIVDKENNDENDIVEKEPSNEKDNKVKELKKDNKERIIIRDPKHSGYKFINGLLKCFLFFIKLIVLPIGISFCASLVSFCIALVVSFMFIKTGFLFLGAFLGLISCIIINIIILNLIYCFLFNRKVKFGVLGISFLGSLILCGIAIGLVIISIKDFKYINSYDEKYFIKNEETIKMQNDLALLDYYSGDIEYIESDSKDIKLVYEHPNYCEVISDKEDNKIYFYHECANNSSNLVKVFIKNINDKVIVNPDYLKIYVYTSKENIDKLKKNYDKYNSEENRLNNKINELNNTINDLEVQIENKDSKLNELNDKINELEQTINERETELEERFND